MRAILSYVLILLSSAAHAAPGGDRPVWGTLFFSAQARRQHGQQIPVTTSFIYSGILSSGTGKPVIWLNNTIQQQLPAGMSWRGNQLIVQQGDQRIHLAPGEGFDAETQQVIEFEPDEEEAS